MESAKKKKRIAVIAVHGVGDQMPFETAHRIGDLLQDLNIGEKPCVDPPPPASQQSPAYYPFHEETIRVNVRPTVVREHLKLPKTAKARGPFDAWVNDCLREQGQVQDEQIWYQFTKGQLSGYEGDKPEDTYQTVRMEGSRAPQDEQDQADVHIYEAYWADLSRLKAGMFSIFTELYQLLFHLPSLGVHAVNAAALHHRTAAWRFFRKLQAYTAGILTVPIPVLNLLILGTITLVVASTAFRNATAARVLSASALGIVLVMVLAWWFWSRLAERQLNPWVWLSPLPLVAVAIYGIAKMVPSSWDRFLQIVASCVVAIIVALLLFLVLRAYDQRRPGALKWAGVISIVTLGAGAASSLCCPADPSHRSVVAFCARLFEVCDIALLFAWAVFFILGLGTCVMGGIAVVGTREEGRLARRSWWTGLLMLSLPALAFLIVTVSAWYVVAAYIPKLLLDTPYCPLWFQLFKVHSVEEITKVVKSHFGIVLESLLLAAGISFIPAIWGLARIVWTEVFPVESTPQSRGDGSVRMGRWLTLALKGLFVSGLILYVATMLFLPLRFSLSALFKGWETFFKGRDPFFAPAVASGTGFLGLFLVRGKQLRKLVLGFRPILDMLLDVDNWFREHPRDSNPKARICGRYVSLLRYVCNWRKDSTDAASGYDGIVIIAHSQGTVITADLLRFLNRESGESLPAYDPELAKLNGIPIYLFTMGCPLRQLYGLRFPHLYHWARHGDQKGMEIWEPRDIPENRLPNPGDLLGVRLWVNCYRSGDYIGRFLWRTDSCGYLWTGDCGGHPPADSTPNNSSDGIQRLEFCIGAGAHTHYWDSTARIVAKELDRLIATLAAN